MVEISEPEEIEKRKIGKMEAGFEKVGNDKALYLLKGQDSPPIA